MLSRLPSEYDFESADHAGGIDDAITTVESLGSDRACVIGGAGIYDLFQSVVDRMVLIQIPGEYDGDTYFPEWDANEWTVVDRAPYDDVTFEDWGKNGGSKRPYQLWIRLICPRQSSSIFSPIVQRCRRELHKNTNLMSMRNNRLSVAYI